METTQSKPAAPRDSTSAETRALAALNQAVWEASQFLAFSEIHAYVDHVIQEIVSDDPD